MSKPSYESSVNNYSSVSKGFQPKFTPKLIQASSNSSSYTDSKLPKDYKTEYKKMKAMLALLKASSSSPHNPKTFQPKNKGLVSKIFDWDEEEVFEDEEVTQVKLLMALANDELTVGKSHARNGEWVDITIRKCRDELLSLKQAKLDAVTFPIQNTKLTKLNHALQEQLKKEKRINEKWLTSSKKVSQCISEQIPHQKKKVLRGTVTASETKQIKPAVPTEVKDTKQESKLNELTKLVQMLIDEKVNPNQMTQESLKIQKTEPSKSIDSSKMSQDSKPKVQNTGSSKILYCMICKREDHRTSDHEMNIAFLKKSENYKAQPYLYASSSKQILKVKAKPFPQCTHCGFNNHRPNYCRNYPECKIYRSYDHSTSRHNHVIHIRGGVLAESSQLNESSFGVKCNTCDSTLHSTSDHNEFDHFKRVRPMFINHEKYTLVIVDEYLRERIPDISYFHVFGCPVFIHNHKDHLGKFDAKDDDGYFLGYSSVVKAFRVYNTRRQQIKKTYHVTLMKSWKPSENHVPEVIILNEHDVPLTEDIEDPPNLIKTERTHEQNVQNDQMITQPTDVSSRNNTKVSRPITEPLVPDVTQSHIPNQASTSSYPVPQDRWLRDQHIELVNIISNPSKGMLTRSMAAKLTATSASECLFADFLSEIEPKKVSKALKHPGWIDAMQEELN
uniref:Retroviral polymerase SH3-like domain-containing protein n=1 Tax=Tanacetum cinerariifolium TaxID=118510 RepID=A0A6L2K493_TANCI|nr:hypothetical protein [Tanacetum cinerariifolium]